MKPHCRLTIRYLFRTMLATSAISLALVSTTAGAQTMLPALPQTDLAQTEAPAPNIRRLLAKGDTAFAAQDWRSYQAIYSQLTQLSPQRGEYWYRLGLAHRSNEQLAAANQAFRQALQLGYRPGRSYLQLARLASAAGQQDEAVRLFEQARSAGLVNAEQELLANAEFSAVLPQLWPRLADDASEADKWTADMHFLASRIEQSAYGESSFKAQISRQIRDLAAPSLSPEARLFGIMRALRQLGSGHSQLYPPFQGPLAFHAAPLRLQFFADGLYVVAAQKPYQALLGHQVTAVGCLSTADWRDAAANILPHDSASGLSFIASLMMVIPEYSRALGCNTAADQLSLTVLAAPVAGGAPTTPQQVQVPAQPLSMAHLQQMLALPLPDAQWLAVQRASVPLSTPTAAKQASRMYWYAPVPDTSLMYWQLNQLRDDPAQSLTDFLQALGQALQQHRASGLILDLRQNNGGNGELVPQILSMLQHQGYLAAAGLPAKLVVLTSGRTFSAAVLLAADLQPYNALFVGEPTGAGAVHIGEENLVLLPNSGLAVAVATRLFVRSDSDDKQPWIAPHLQVQSSFAQYQAGEDPVLQAAVALLKQP